MFASLTMRWLVLLLAAVSVLFALAACAPPELAETPSNTPAAIATGSSPEPTPIHTTLPPPSIPEKESPVRKQPPFESTWRLESYVVNHVTQHALPDHPATLTLEDGRFSGNTGCNGLSGTYVVQGDTISFELGPMTMRACLDTVAEQEAAYLAGLKQAAHYRIEDGKFTLYDAQGNLLLIFSRQEPISLTTGSWQLLFLNNGQGGMVSNPIVSHITALFDEHRVSGNAGCNHYSAAYQQDEGQLRVDEIVVTEMICDDPEVMETESTFLQNLSQAAEFRIQGDRLTIFDEEGRKLLVFKHRAEPGLTDVTWRLASIGPDAKTPVSTITSRVQLTFSPDGDVFGNAGCNTFRGHYAVEDGHIEVGPLVTTRKMCEENVMAVERAVLQGLERSTAFEIKNGQLDLFDETGSLLLTFVPAS